MGLVTLISLLIWNTTFASLDGLSLHMRGKPLNSDEKKEVTLTVTDWMERWKKEDSFNDTLTKYWLRVLKIQKISDPLDVKNPITQDNYRILLQKNNTPKLYAIASTCPNISKVYIIEGKDTCACADIIQIKPKWSKDPQPICPITQSICGASLENCLPLGNNALQGGPGLNESWWQDIVKGFTEEPGRYIAKIIMEDRSWTDVIQSQNGLMNGIMGYFVTTLGQSFREASPPGTQFGSAWDPNSRDFVWTPGSPSHAGVLTTLSYQGQHNGWRAKAVVAMDAFLCRKFVVPDGAVPIPSAETNLMIKPYCSICHLTLEPLSRFFHHWPNVGAPQGYSFFPNDKTVGAEFQGWTGQDVPDLAKAYIATKDFNECAIKRTFEFISGRSLTSQELLFYLPQWVQTLEKNKSVMWPVFLQIANTLEKGAP